MNTFSPIKIQIIIGSTRPNRFSEKPAQWIYGEAKKRKDLDIELLDLRDYPMPNYDEPMSPKMLKGNYKDGIVKKWVRKVGEADGYIIVSPEYNHGYPAVLKTALDYPYYEWNRKAVGFVSWGSAGGARVVEQLRQVAVELQMVPIQPSIHIPPAVFLAVRNPKEEDAADPYEPLKDRLSLFLDELTWWSKALKIARKEPNK